MGIAFFAGCIASLRYPGIEASSLAVLDRLGVELQPMEGSSCCPAPGVVPSFNRATWVAMGGRNLAIAERKGQDLLTICNGCFTSLFEAAHVMAENPAVLREVNSILQDINMTYTPHGVEVRHFAEFLARDVGDAVIRRSFKNKLDLRVAVHYGCHFLKPSKYKQLDDPERPTMVDKLVELTGAESVHYKEKMMCCGAGGGVRARNPSLALKMTEEKLRNMKATGADVIVNVCPFCHLQLDRGQREIANGFDLPVLHLSQLYALAMDLDPKVLGFEAHDTPVKLKV